MTFDSSTATSSELDGKILWRYYYVKPSFRAQVKKVEPVKGVLAHYCFHKIDKFGEPVKHGTYFSYYSRFAEAEAEAVEDYNRIVEEYAAEYEKKADEIMADLL